MKNSLRKRLILIISLFFILAFFTFVWAYNVGTNFTICTSTVVQPACYSGSFPTPTLNWTVTGSSSQTNYQVQIDNNSNFSSPEIDTGSVSSANKYYQVNAAKLSFGGTYYWRVKIMDNFGSWIGSWVNADSAFTTVPLCNQNPVASNLVVAIGNYCSSPSQYFSWTYSDPDGDNESRFQFQVDNNSNFSSPEINRDYSGLSNSSPTTNNQTVVVSVSLIADKFVYNTTYYWRVKVYDPNGADSGWVNGSNFTTEKHQYPLIDFNWSPSNPSQGEDALFADQSTVYGGASKSAWSWIFTDGNPAGSSQQNPTIQFNSTEDEQATLQVTDSDGYSCSVSKTVNIQLELPGWEEK